MPTKTATKSERIVLFADHFVIEAEHILPQKALRRRVHVSLRFQSFFQIFTSSREKQRTDSNFNNLSQAAEAIAPKLSVSSTCQNPLETRR